MGGQHKKSRSIGGGRHSRRRNSAVLSVVLTLFLTSSVYAGTCTQSRLDMFVGNWTARGSAQANPDVEREQVRCQVTFTAAGVERIETSGLCATTAETWGLAGWLACDGSDFTGPLFAADGEDPPVFIRDLSGDEGIVLVLEGLDQTSQRIERYRLNISSPTPNVMQIGITRGAWAALNLRYSRVPE